MLAALMAPGVSRLLPRAAGLALSLLAAGLFGWFLACSGVVADFDYVAEAFSWWPALDGVWAWHLDPLSTLFALLIVGNGALNLAYSHGYFRQDEASHPSPAARADTGRFLSLLLWLMAAMLGLVLADHLLLVYVFWELASLVTSLLIGFYRKNEAARVAAVRTVAVQGIGSAALLGAIWLLQDAGGSYLLSDLLQRGDVLRAAPSYPVILGLVLVAVAARSSLFPFHFWLEGTVLSPTPASAAVGAVKGGIFLLARLHPVLGETTAWTTSLLVLGGLTMLLGGFTGLFHTDAKRIVVSLTVAALGMITALLGLDNEYAIKTALLLLVGQVIYKTSLYMGIGVITHRIHTRDVTQMRNLWRLFPLTASATMAAALSKSGVYPFFGSVKKSGFLEALVYDWEIALWLVVPAMLATMMMLVMTLSVGWHPFSSDAPRWLRWPFGSRNPREKPSSPAKVADLSEGHSPSLAAIVPIVLLGLSGFLFGLFPRTFLDPWIVPASEMVLGGALEDFRMSPFKDWSKETTFLGLFGITLGLLVFLGRRDLWAAGARGSRGSLSARLFDETGRWVVRRGAQLVRVGRVILARRWALLAATVSTCVVLWVVAVFL